MPLPAEGLGKESSNDQIKSAVAESIKMCMDEGGRSQEQCIAMAYSMARRATGRKIGKKSISLGSRLGG